MGGGGEEIGTYHEPSPLPWLAARFQGRRVASVSALAVRPTTRDGVAVDQRLIYVIIDEHIVLLEVGRLRGRRASLCAYGAVAVRDLLPRVRDVRRGGDAQSWQIYRASYYVGGRPGRAGRAKGVTNICAQRRVEKSAP
jgi:hypothetical protein